MDFYGSVVVRRVVQLSVARGVVGEGVSRELQKENYLCQKTICEAYLFICAHMVGSLRSAIGLLAADVGTTWAAREGVQQGARHHNA